MSTTLMINMKVKPDHVGDVEEAVQRMFAALEQHRPEGIRYASLRLADGVTFVALLQVADGIENPLPQIPEFVALQQSLPGWAAEPGVSGPAEVVGSYGLF